MKNLPILILAILSIAMSCHKSKAKPDPEPEPVVVKDPYLTFVFVNRYGFRKDSTHHGFNDTVFQGVCISSYFYDKVANETHLDNICYNRNNTIPSYNLTDSIVFRSYRSSVNSRFAFQVDLAWKYPIYPYSARGLKYTTKYYNTDKGDTIKIAKDTVIKFIWPDDTASGKFVKTYQWP